jgi:PST family polysaccharide transporter
MGAPAATPVVRILALSIVTGGVVAVPAAMLERHFRQDRKMISDQVNGWLSAGISIAMASAGYGAMSIAVGSVAGALAGGILIIIFSPLPLRFGFKVAQARRLLKFGLPLAGSSFVVFLVGNVDNFIAGHVLGATALGFYVLAWNLSSWPVNMFSTPVRSVAPAFFSRLQHDPPAMRTGFVSATALLCSVTLPICLLISGSARPVIGLVYGARWAPAEQALVWLALLGALRILFWLAYDYFVVLARSRVVFTVQLVWLLALIPTLIAGARLAGIAGVAMGGIAVALLVVLPWYLVELSSAGVRVRALAVRVWQPLAVSVAVGAAAWAAARVIPNDLAACFASGTIALAAIGLLGLKMRPVIAELRPVLAARNGLSPAEADADSDTAPEPAAARSNGTVPGSLPVSPPADPVGQEAGMLALLALSARAPSASAPSVPAQSVTSPDGPGLSNFESLIYADDPGTP